MTFEPGLLVTLILGLVGGGGINELFKTWRDRRTGKEEREVREVERINSYWERDRLRADSAEAAEDLAQERARIYAEHASYLRRLLQERCGFAPEDLPKWPTSR